MARNGKIARLPQDIRDELNQRLADNEKAAETLAWLNGMERVKEIAVRDFGGREINKQNLSEWRRGGFAEWEMQRSFCKQASRRRRVSDLITNEANDLDETFVDSLSEVMAVRLAELLVRWDGEVTEELERKLKWLRMMSQEVARLQRGQADSAMKRNTITRRALEDAERAADRAEEDDDSDGFSRENFLRKFLENLGIVKQSVKPSQGEEEELEEEEDVEDEEDEVEETDEADEAEATTDTQSVAVEEVKSKVAGETVETVGENGGEMKSPG